MSETNKRAMKVLEEYVRKTQMERDLVGLLHGILRDVRLPRNPYPVILQMTRKNALRFGSKVVMADLQETIMNRDLDVFVGGAGAFTFSKRFPRVIGAPGIMQWLDLDFLAEIPETTAGKLLFPPFPAAFSQQNYNTKGKLKFAAIQQQRPQSNAAGPGAKFANDFRAQHHQADPQQSSPIRTAAILSGTILYAGRGRALHPLASRATITQLVVVRSETDADARSYYAETVTRRIMQLQREEDILITEISFPQTGDFHKGDITVEPTHLLEEIAAHGSTHIELAWRHHNPDTPESTRLWIVAKIHFVLIWDPVLRPGEFVAVHEPVPSELLSECVMFSEHDVQLVVEVLRSKKAHTTGNAAEAKASLMARISKRESQGDWVGVCETALLASENQKLVIWLYRICNSLAGAIHGIIPGISFEQKLVEQLFVLEDLMAQNKLYRDDDETNDAEEDMAHAGLLAKYQRALERFHASMTSILNAQLLTPTARFYRASELGGLIPAIAQHWTETGAAIVRTTPLDRMTAHSHLIWLHGLLLAVEGSVGHDVVEQSNLFMGMLAEALKEAPPVDRATPVVPGPVASISISERIDQVRSARVVPDNVVREAAYLSYVVETGIFDSLREMILGIMQVVPLPPNPWEDISMQLKTLSVRLTVQVLGSNENISSHLFNNPVPVKASEGSVFASHLVSKDTADDGNKNGKGAAVYGTYCAVAIASPVYLHRQIAMGVCRFLFAPELDQEQDNLIDPRQIFCVYGAATRCPKVISDVAHISLGCLWTIAGQTAGSAASEFGELVIHMCLALHNAGHFYLQLLTLGSLSLSLSDLLNDEGSEFCDLVASCALQRQPITCQALVGPVFVTIRLYFVFEDRISGVARAYLDELDAVHHLTQGVYFSSKQARYGIEALFAHDLPMHPTRTVGHDRVSKIFDRLTRGKLAHMRASCDTAGVLSVLVSHALFYRNNKIIPHIVRCSMGITSTLSALKKRIDNLRRKYLLLVDGIFGDSRLHPDLLRTHWEQLRSDWNAVKEKAMALTLVADSLVLHRSYVLLNHLFYKTTLPAFDPAWATARGTHVPTSPHSPLLTQFAFSSHSTHMGMIGGVVNALELGYETLFLTTDSSGFIREYEKQILIDK